MMVLGWRWAMAGLVVGLVGACGGGDSSPSAAASASACPVESLGDNGPVEIVVWHRGDVPHERMGELVDRFNEEQHDVAVRLEFPEGPWWRPMSDAVAAADEGRPVADVLTGPGEWLPALRAADIVAPLSSCIEATGFDVSGVPSEAAAQLRLNGELWGLPDNVFTFLLVYDRRALADAGFDPAAPPSTLSELREVAAAVADLGRYEAPLGLNAGVVFHHASGAGITRDGDVVVDSPQSRAIFDWLSDMGSVGLLYIPPDEPRPLYEPIAAGRVAMQVVSEREVWALADAISQGQVPEGDLAVAPVPGLERASVPMASTGRYLTTASTPGRRAAAWRFLEWLAEPAQQAELHMITDAYPYDASAAADPSLQRYWRDMPLLGEGWEALQGEPQAVFNDPAVPGQTRMLNDALLEVAYRGASVDERLALLVAEERRLLQLGVEDPVGLITCQLDLRPLPYCEAG